MKRDLGWFLGGAALVSLSAFIACSGSSPGSLGVGTGDTGGGSDDNPGEACRTDNCSPACGNGQSCCNGKCVDLSADINNCGQCCKSCPNPHPICLMGQCTLPPRCTTADCTADQFCCDNACCDEASQACCPTAGGGFACKTPDATGNCPK